jgi:DNA repair exonuclease SbcCD ATPase subunit
LNLT